jgi:TPR repeat protein
MGELYYKGYGTEKNLDKSFKYFKKAAKYKFTYAEYRTALFYLEEKEYLDTDRGIKYLKRAARNGHTESAFLLALTYGSGELTDKDTEESDKWLNKAIKGKNSKSKSYASFLHQSGELTYQDYPKVSTMIALLREEAKPITHAEQTDLMVEETKINWPEESDLEVIQVSAPSVEAIFDHELAYLTISPPTSKGTTGTRIIGKSCDDMISCGTSSHGDFERLIKQLWL